MDRIGEYHDFRLPPGNDLSVLVAIANGVNNDSNGMAALAAKGIAGASLTFLASMQGNLPGLQSGHAIAGVSADTTEIVGIFDSLGVGYERAGLSADLAGAAFSATIDSHGSRQHVYSGCDVSPPTAVCLDIRDGVRALQDHAPQVGSAKMAVEGLGTNGDIRTYEADVRRDLDTSIMVGMATDGIAPVTILVEKFATADKIHTDQKNAIDRALADEYNAAAGQTRVVILSMKEFAQQNIIDVGLMDADGVHLSPAGYKIAELKIVEGLGEIRDRLLAEASIAAAIPPAAAPAVQPGVAPIKDSARVVVFGSSTSSGSRPAQIISTAPIAALPTIGPIHSEPLNTLKSNPPPSSNINRPATVAEPIAASVAGPNTINTPPSGSTIAPGPSSPFVTTHLVTFGSAAKNEHQGTPLSAADSAQITQLILAGLSPQALVPAAIGVEPPPAEQPVAPPATAEVPPTPPPEPAPVEPPSPPPTPVAAVPGTSQPPAQELLNPEAIKAYQVLSIIRDSVFANGGILQQDAAKAAYEIIKTFDTHPGPELGFDHPEAAIKLPDPTADFPWVHAPDTCDATLFDQPGGILGMMTTVVVFEWHMAMPEYADMRNAGAVIQFRDAYSKFHNTHQYGVQADIASMIITSAPDGANPDGPVFNMHSPNYNRALTASVNLHVGLAAGPDEGYLTDHIETSDGELVNEVNAAGGDGGRKTRIDIKWPGHETHEHYKFLLAEAADGIEDGMAPGAPCTHSFVQPDDAMFQALMARRATYGIDSAAVAPPPAELPPAAVEPPPAAADPSIVPPPAEVTEPAPPADAVTTVPPTDNEVSGSNNASTGPVNVVKVVTFGHAPSVSRPAAVVLSTTTPAPAITASTTHGGAPAQGGNTTAEVNKVKQPTLGSSKKAGNNVAKQVPTPVPVTAPVAAPGDTTTDQPSLGGNPDAPDKPADATTNDSNNQVDNGNTAADGNQVVFGTNGDQTASRPATVTVAPPLPDPAVIFDTAPPPDTSQDQIPPPEAQPTAGTHFELAPNYEEIIDGLPKLSPENKEFLKREVSVIWNQSQLDGSHTNPRVKSAQVDHETGHGKSRLAVEGNNWVGAKAPKGYQGPIMKVNDDEPQASSFYVFETPEESIAYLDRQMTTKEIYADSVANYLNDRCYAMGLIFKVELDPATGECRIIGRESQYATVHDANGWPIYDQIMMDKIDALDLTEIFPLVA